MKPPIKHNARQNFAGKARAHLEKALKVYVDALEDPDPNVRIKAATEVINRAIGRSVDIIELSRDNPLDAMSEADLRAKLAEMLVKPGSAPDVHPEAPTTVQ